MQEPEGLIIDVRTGWVRVRAGEWVMAYRFVNQEGRPVIAEVRVFPGTGEWDPGLDEPWDWSEQPTDVPPGGLPSRLLRQVKPAEVLEWLAGYLAEDDAGEEWTLRDALTAMGVDTSSFQTKPHPGRAGRPDRYYAEIAAMYVQALGSSKPVKNLEGQLHLSAGRIRDLLYEARRRELLTEAPKGRPGGRLTDKAKALLREDES